MEKVSKAIQFSFTLTVHTAMLPQLLISLFGLLTTGLKAEDCILPMSAWYFLFIFFLLHFEFELFFIMCNCDFSAKGCHSTILLPSDTSSHTLFNMDKYIVAWIMLVSFCLSRSYHRFYSLRLPRHWAMNWKLLAKWSSPRAKTTKLGSKLASLSSCIRRQKSWVHFYIQFAWNLYADLCNFVKSKEKVLTNFSVLVQSTHQYSNSKPLPRVILTMKNIQF